MTREQAIKIIDSSDIMYYDADEAEAFGMAIAALRGSEKIIRCEGCHYYEDGHCDMHHMGVSLDDYCSYAVGKYKI